MLDTHFPMLEKCCLVSVGATTTFTSLISTIFTPEFLFALVQQGFTRLIVQCGADAAYFSQVAAEFTHDKLVIDVVAYVDDLRALMVMCRAEEGMREAGVLVCHAGTGTVLDAMSVRIPIIVVPNTDLQDNHQVELAEELDKQAYAVHGRLDDLPTALEDSAALTHHQRLSSPPTTVHPDPSVSAPRNPNLWSVVDSMSHHRQQQPEHPLQGFQTPVEAARFRSALEEGDWKESVERLAVG